MQIILIGLGIYLLYRFIFGFIIPLYTTVRQVKKQFRDSKNNSNAGGGFTTNPSTKTDNTPKHTTSGKPGKNDDYIEFEEL